MPTFSSLQIPPPANWQDFETLCCDLWRKIWKDPNTKEHGRPGQPQHGVDIYGNPNQGNLWAGVQCKCKDTLTETEVKAEVEKAKSFKPELSEFIIATTGPKDAKIEEVARKITEEHQSNGLFSVYICSWEDIKNRLADFPELVEKHYPWLSPNTEAVKKDLDELKKTFQASFKIIEEVKPSISSLSQKIDRIAISNPSETSSIILTTEYQAELDYARNLINNYKPIEALVFLERLRDRLWSSAQPNVKFRLLTNIGSAKLSLKEEQEAAKLFLEALQYNPEDEKALCNAALGYLLLGQLREARTYAEKVLTKNPASTRAYSLIIQTSHSEEDLETIVGKVPEPFRSSPEVAYAIGHLASKSKNLVKAREWLEIAIEDDKENLPELKGSLGGVLLELVLQDEPFICGNQLKDEQRRQIHYAIQLLTSAWDRITGTDLRKSRYTWIMNRGLAKRFLGDVKGAIKDIEIALEIEPSDPILIKNRASLAYESGENKMAKELLQKILLNKETPEAPLLFAQVLCKEGNCPEAINKAVNIITEFLKNNPPQLLQEEGNRLLMRIYIDSKDFGRAQNISNSMRASDPTNILYLVDAARISRYSGNSNDAIFILNEAKRHITKSTAFGELLEFANELYSLEQYEEAANIYERIVDTHLNTSLTYKLLNSYFRAGITGKALGICQTLRKSYGPLEYVTEMESAIYEEVGNLQKAEEVCQEYLNLFPDDFNMKLRKAIVNYRAKNFGELDSFLSSVMDISNLSLESGIQVASLCAARTLYQKALELMYQIRRKFFNNPDAHLKYIGLFLENEKKYNTEWLSPVKVCIDSAVCVEDSSGQQDWYIIVDREDADMHRKEINQQHPLAKKLLNKSIGGEVLLKEDFLSKESGKVVEIKSKYVYALHESLSQFNKLFPDKPGFWSLNVQHGFQPVFDLVSSQHERSLQVERFYKEGKLTVGAFANLIGKSVLDVWSGLVSSPDLGLKCCEGNIEERKHALSLLSNKPRLIADIISLKTLQSLNIGDVIIKAFGKLGIAQSTKEVLHGVISQRKGIESQGFMTLGKEGDKFVRQAISAEDVKRNIEHLESIMRWLEDNCEIIPCQAALGIKRERKEQLEKLIGPAFIDTVLIASEPGNMLYSDDERLRNLAKTEFSLEGVWTQAVLMYCLSINVLEESKYNETIIKLACLNYRHTSINADILIEASRQSKWLPSYPYTNVLGMLRGNNSDENSALIVSSNFLYELWKQPILAHQRTYLILSLLDIIMAERDRRKTLNKLRSCIKKRFFLLSLAEREVLELIAVWEKLHIL